MAVVYDNGQSYMAYVVSSLTIWTLGHVIGSMMTIASQQLYVGICYYSQALIGRAAVNIDKLASL